MAVPPRLPEPPRRDPLRVLAAIALLAVIFAALSVGVLAWTTRAAVDNVDAAVQDVQDAARRVERDSRSIDPTLDALREAARRLNQIDQSVR